MTSESDLTTETIAQIATDLLEENEDKSLPWCAAIASDICNCEYMDVIDALIKHPEISGFKQRTKE